MGDNCDALRTRPPAFIRRGPRAGPVPSLRDERSQRWDWVPEREVVVGRTGVRLEDVLARCTALYGRDGDR